MENAPNWHHAPPHHLDDRGFYMVTASTYGKLHYFQDSESKSMLTTLLINICCEYGWELHAWSILSNHYHFLAVSSDDAKSLVRIISKLHTQSAKWINQRDNHPGRKVWFQYWESKITYGNSYWSRLRYVHENPVRHGIVRNAGDYPWCSAGWFYKNADPSMKRRMLSYKTDKLKVIDDF